MNKKKIYRLGLIFLGVLLLGSPLIKGGESWQTMLWLRPWILGFVLFYFLIHTHAGKLELKIPTPGWLLFSWILILSASLLFTHYYYLSIFWYLTFLVYFLFFIFCVNIFLSPVGSQLISVLIGMLFFIGLIESLTGVVQFFLSGSRRVSGTFFNPAYYTGFLTSLLSFPLASLLFDLFPKFSRAQKLCLKIFSAVLSCLMFGAMLLSASRSIIFALIPLGIILTARFRFRAILAVFALASILAIIPNPLRTRLLNLKQDPYAWERVNIWKTSIKMIRHHPLGVGLGMYGYYSPRYQEPFQGIKYGRYGLLVSQAHNEFLNFAVEGSLAVPVLAVAFLGLVFYRVAQALKKLEKNSSRYGLLIGFSSSLLSLLGHSLVDYIFHQPPIIILSLINLSVLISLSSKVKPSLIKTHTIFLKSPFLLRSLFTGITLILAIFVFGQSLLEGLALRALTNKNPSRGLKQLFQLSRFALGNAEIYFQLGKNLELGFEKTGDSSLAKSAVTFLERACQLNPENQEYLYTLSQSYYYQALFFKDAFFLKKALEYAQKAISKAPGQVFSYSLLARIYMYKNDLFSAKQTLLIALDYEPYFLRARAQLIKILKEEGNFKEAQNQLEILRTQYFEVQEFLRLNPELLNSYQRQVISLSEEELNEL